MQSGNTGYTAKFKLDDDASPRGTKLLKLDFRESLKRPQTSNSEETLRARPNKFESSLCKSSCDAWSDNPFLIGVELAEIASLISSSFFAMLEAALVAALLMLLKPPCKISDFFVLKLGL